MRIIIADDQPNVRYGLRVLLSRSQDLILVGEAEDAEELEELLENSPVDLLIVDWMLPGLAEVGSFTELRQYHPSLIIITLSGRPELGREAIMAGADAFVSKIDPPDKLLSTMDYFKDQLEKSSMSL